MAGAGFHSIAKLRAQILNAVLVYRGSRRIATEKIAILPITMVRGPNLREEYQRPEPPAGFILGLRAGVGNPQNIGEPIAKQLFLLCQTAALERGV
jgi:hypothetical protein